jgi:hypothetical protein
VHAGPEVFYVVFNHGFYGLQFGFQSYRLWMLEMLRFQFHGNHINVWLNTQCDTLHKSFEKEPVSIEWIGW